MAAPIHQARQNRADLEREIHELKTRGRAIMSAGGDETQLTAIDKSINAKSAELGVVLQELALLEVDQSANAPKAHAWPLALLLCSWRARAAAGMRRCSPARL